MAEISSLIRNPAVTTPAKEVPVMKTRFENALQTSCPTHTSVPAPTPSSAPYSAAVVAMSATGSFDGSGVSIATRPASDTRDHLTGLPPRAAPV